MGHIPVIFLAVILISACCISTSSDSATVQEVIDGDTVDVIFENGTEERIRLIGVDTPETRGENNPSEFGMNSSIEAEECLRKYGNTATVFVQNMTGKKIRVVQDSIQDKRGGYGRLLAYVYVGNRSISLNQLLLEKGYARVYYSQFAQKNSFVEAERRAKSTILGLWSCP